MLPPPPLPPRKLTVPASPDNNPTKLTTMITDVRVLNGRTLQYLIGFTICPDIRWVDAESLDWRWDIKTMVFWRSNPETMKAFEPMELGQRYRAVRVADHDKKRIIGRRPMARFPLRGIRLLEYLVIDGSADKPRWIEAADEWVTDEMIGEFVTQIGEGILVKEKQGLGTAEEVGNQ